MPFHHRLFGTTARTDAPVPGLPLAPGADPGLRIHYGTLPPGPPPEDEPWYRAARTDSRGEALLVVHAAPGGRWWLRYADGTAFVVDTARGEIWTAWPPSLTPEDTATYLLGPVMGFTLRMRGTTCLHASAVEVGSGAVLVTGPAGAGKSTTAAAFARAGHRVLSDDVSPLLPRADGGFDVQPAIPQVRLWPDAAEALFGDADALPRLTPTWDKRRLDLGPGFHDAPLPVRAVYVLAGRGEALEAPRLERLKGARAVMALVSNVYMGYLPDAAARARDLPRLARLTGAVPVVRVTPPDDPARLGALVEALAADAASW